MQRLCLQISQEQPYLKAWPGTVCTQAHPCGCQQNWVLTGSWLEATLSSLPQGPLGRANGFHLSAVPCSAWHCGFSKWCLVILTLNSSCEREVCMPPVASDINRETLLYPAVAPTPGMKPELLMVCKAVPVTCGLVTLPRPCWTPWCTEFPPGLHLADSFPPSRSELNDFFRSLGLLFHGIQCGTARTTHWNYVSMWNSPQPTLSTSNLVIVWLIPAPVSKLKPGTVSVLFPPTNTTLIITDTLM